MRGDGKLLYREGWGRGEDLLKCRTRIGWASSMAVQVTDKRKASFFSEDSRYLRIVVFRNVVAINCGLI